MLELDVGEAALVEALPSVLGFAGERERAPSMASLRTHSNVSPATVQLSAPGDSAHQPSGSWR